MKFKLTSLEKKWVLYDVGNSAFTMMVSTIFPIYFNYLAGNAGISDVDYLAYWGYATSVCTLLVAILGPTLGAIADTKNFKKTVFFVAMGVGVFGCILLGFLSSWIWFLGIFVLAKTGYSASLIFYDAMLTDVTDPERMDAVSSHGYAWGYIGSCIPFVACLGVVLGAKPLGIGMQTAMIIAFIITALWWLLSSVPLLRSYRQKYFAKIIPAEKSGEYFGIYDICGKGASVIGTALVSFISQMTGSINIAVSALSVMFLVGLVLFRYSAKLNSVR